MSEEKKTHPEHKYSAIFVSKVGTMMNLSRISVALINQLAASFLFGTILSCGIIKQVVLDILLEGYNGGEHIRLVACRLRARSTKGTEFCKKNSLSKKTIPSIYIPQFLPKLKQQDCSHIRAKHIILLLKVSKYYSSSVAIPILI